MADNETTTTPVTAVPSAPVAADPLAVGTPAEHTISTDSSQPLDAALNSLVATKKQAPEAQPQAGTDGDTKRPTSDIGSCP